MTYTHKRVGGRKMKTKCGKWYSVFNPNISFFWKDVTCKRCLSKKEK